MRYLVRLYPNRELRVVRCPSRLVRAEPSPKVVPLQIPAGGIQEAVEAEPEGDAGEPEASPSPLTLRPNSEPLPRSGYGTMGRETRFGVNARRSLLRCGGVFDLEKIPPEEVVFLTGTLPGGTMDAMVALASWSSCIVDRLKSWVSKRAKSTYSLYVWERQRRGALHLHYAVHIPCPVARHSVLAGFKSWWASALHRVGANSGVDMFAWANGRGTWADRPDVVQADAQLCQRTISGYLAKYASKEEGKGGAHADAEGVVAPWPVRWWGCSRPLLEACRRYTESIEVDGLSYSSSRQKDELVYELFAKAFYSPRERGRLERDGGDAESVEAGGSTWHSYTDKAGSSRVWVGYGPQARDAWNEIVPIFKRDYAETTVLDRNGAESVGQVRGPVEPGKGNSYIDSPLGADGARDLPGGRGRRSKGRPCTSTMLIEGLCDGVGNGGVGPSGLSPADRPTVIRLDNNGRPAVHGGWLGSVSLLYCGYYWKVVSRVAVRDVPYPRQGLAAERVSRRTVWAWCRMAASRH